MDIVAASQGKRFPPYHRETKGKCVENEEAEQSKTCETKD